MPTISQLPPATSVSDADEVPISQAGVARSVSVGALLARTQPEIIVGSLSLVGRTSLGSGAPEQVDIGTGVSIIGGTLVADGLDHAAFPPVLDLDTQADLVISSQGTPMLMQASLLRGLFSAGQNVAIDSNGVISTAGNGTAEPATPIGNLKVISSLAAQDLVAVSHGGLDYAIGYSNLLNGVTIDQAQKAGSANNSDVIWVAQAGNVMAAQTFSAIWTWMAQKLAVYKPPVVEITINSNLNAADHNGRVLVCSRPITLTPITSNMGSGFHCTVINASSGSVTFGSGFVSSSGSMVLAAWQSATIRCLTYSSGIVAFAAMPATVTATILPGQPTGLAVVSAGATTVSISWQVPLSGGVVSSYIVQFRVTGTTTWNNSSPVVGATSYQLTALQPATSYDVVVVAQNATGSGASSAVLTAQTVSLPQISVPVQVTGLTATPTSGSAIQVSWSAQSSPSAASSFTIQYRITGQSGWTSTVPGITANTALISGLSASTSYDFSVFGANSAGAGPSSMTVTAETGAPSASVMSITWNLLPGGPYTHANGSIGVNAHVSPANASVQFGFSASAMVPPSTWTAALLVNTDLWGAYVPTPAASGTWYTWGQGLDGSASTVSATSFLVQ